MQIIVAPLVEDLSKEYEGRLHVGKLNVDDSPSVAVKYGVRSVPTILVFKNGNVVDKVVGAVPRNILVSKIQAHL